MRSFHLVIVLFALQARTVNAQPLKHVHGFTHADTLRGSNGPFRAWWDVTHYDITVRPQFATKSIEGTTRITFRTLSPGRKMQIDLQQPLELRSVSLRSAMGESDLHYTRDGNVAWVDLPQEMAAGASAQLVLHYGGIPREARNPPWDGGWIWKKDPQGNPWISAACQGLGASVWYPCKDIQSDEPDSASMHIITPDTLQAVGNGRLRIVEKNADGTNTWTWAVVDPINNYDLIPAIGKYAHIHEVYPGESGLLDCDYWVLASNEAKAREHFKEVPRMLKCFEHWFGPYPFYADGYKLVEAPELGMEHQSAIAYGNHFKNGYLGTDLSGTGWGLKWDYIIIHESAHEWFGNSITTADIADMWVHEGFADYAETIYTQCQSGESAGDDYVIGLRKNIENDIPIIGPYGVNQEGSSDMYYKGANMIHTIRHIMANDSLFRDMLRGMNLKFRHGIVTSAEVEQFISDRSGQNFSKLFQQYLRTTEVPELQWGIRKGRLMVRWDNCVDGFAMPIKITVNGEERTVPISTAWSSPASGLHPKTASLLPDRNWYVRVDQLSGKELRRAIKR